jgi:opacity protein-like surface antigen
MKSLVAVLSLVALVGCISASAAAEKVRTTSNPEVVRGCTFLGNVRATSGWGGSGGTGIAGNNTDVTLREKTAKLGGNVVYVVESGIHAAGEAYQCETPSPGPTRIP